MLSADIDAVGSGDERLLLGGNTSRVWAAIHSLLDQASHRSAVLVLEGEPGIGKTTHLLAALDEAERRDIRVLLSRPSEAESRLAYAALADLVSTVEVAVLETLPTPQRVALERVLSRAPMEDAPTDPAATAAALLSVVQRLSERSPLLLVVDDLQWVDSSSRQALASVARRAPDTVSMVVTVRSGFGDEAGSWLQPRRPEALSRVAVPPLPREDIESLVATRLGRAVSRVALEQIHRVARGNPFFALELARSMGDDPDGRTAPELPETLADVVRSRLAGTGPEVRQALLVVASLAEPTVELVGEALDLSAQTTAQVVEEAEERRLLQLDRGRLRFTHPLLAAGVYAGASPRPTPGHARSAG